MAERLFLGWSRPLLPMAAEEDGFFALHPRMKALHAALPLPRVRASG